MSEGARRIWLIIAVAVFVGGIVLAANAYDHQVNGPNPECVGLSQVHINDPQSPQEAACAAAIKRRQSDGRTAGLPWLIGGLVLAVGCYAISRTTFAP